MRGRCLEEATYSLKGVIFVQVGDFMKRWHLQKIPIVKKATKIKHLCGFGYIAENSRSLTIFHDSVSGGGHCATNCLSVGFG